MQRLIKISIIWMVIIFGICGCQSKKDTLEVLPEIEQVKPEQTAKEESREQSDETVEKKKEEKQTKTIVVYVCGAVAHAGVYELPKGSRVYEAIAMAGGMTEQAAAASVNQAQLLSDEEQVYVPSVEEAAQSTQPGGGSGAQNGRVNLNTATKEVLMTLPGIGESKAESIIQYREKHGRFRSIEEITEIEGIKDGVFQKIKEKITIS